MHLRGTVSGKKRGLQAAGLCCGTLTWLIAGVRRLARVNQLADARGSGALTNLHILARRLEHVLAFACAGREVEQRRHARFVPCSHSIRSCSMRAARPTLQSACACDGMPPLLGLPANDGMLPTCLLPHLCRQLQLPAAAATARRCSTGACSLVATSTFRALQCKDVVAEWLVYCQRERMQVAQYNVTDVINFNSLQRAPAASLGGTAHPADCLASIQESCPVQTLPGAS